MTMLSARLTKALAKGRVAPPPPTRLGLLEVLLRKRATAHAVGDLALEALLRDQIKWSLPVQCDGIERR
ncbi:hypothetical protein [Sphingomonas sp.]|uniref:hypothetical protein n=1 Tax=Sphingomonas sp. TaxID=28214 RepID=UPI003CC6916D